jgi:hypothetical protein
MLKAKSGISSGVLFLAATLVGHVLVSAQAYADGVTATVDSTTVTAEGGIAGLSGGRGVGPALSLTLGPAKVFAEASDQNGNIATAAIKAGPQLKLDGVFVKDDQGHYQLPKGKAELNMFSGAQVSAGSSSGEALSAGGLYWAGVTAERNMSMDRPVDVNAHLGAGWEFGNQLVRFTPEVTGQLGVARTGHLTLPYLSATGSVAADLCPLQSTHFEACVVGKVSATAGLLQAGLSGNAGLEGRYWNSDRSFKAYVGGGIEEAVLKDYAGDHTFYQGSGKAGIAF